jgi:hypothetical protein
VLARTVLKLIWLAQDALSVFGVIDLAQDDQNGLRCGGAF